MKGAQPKQKSALPAMPIKSKVTSQGEMPAATRFESMRNQTKPTEPIHHLEHHPTHGKTEINTDRTSSKVIRASVSPNKQKTDSNTAKKKANESMVLPSPRASSNIKPKAPNQKVESTKHNTFSSYKVPLNSELPNSKSKSQTTKKETVPSLRASQQVDSADKNKIAIKYSSNAPNLETEHKKINSEEGLPVFKKFISDENFFSEEKEKGQNSQKTLGENSMCNENFIMAEKPIAEEKENSFCEITSKQDVLTDSQLPNFIDSFRVPNPTEIGADKKTNAVAMPEPSRSLVENNFFEKKEASGEAGYHEAHTELLNTIEKLNNLKSENNQNLTSFFLLGSQAINVPDDDRVEVILNKRLDRKQSSRKWKDDMNLASPGAISPTDNPFFKNDLDLTEIFSLKKKSPKSSVETPKRLSNVTDTKNFETFRPPQNLEIANGPKFTFTSSPGKPAQKTIAESYSFNQFTSGYVNPKGSKTRFDEIMLSSSKNDSQPYPQRKLTESENRLKELASDNQNSAMSVKNLESLSSLGFACPNCKYLFNKRSVEQLVKRSSEENLQQFSEKRLFDKSEQLPNSKRLLPPPLNNQSSKFPLKTDHTYKTPLNKTNSGGIELAVLGTSKASGENAWHQEPGEIPQAENLPVQRSIESLGLSQQFSRNEAPLKTIMSIFKKIVVFNTKWEKIKETLFLKSPDIVLRAAHNIAPNLETKITWAYLSDFLQKRQIVFQKQQLARLLFYVQSFSVAKDSPLAALSTYSFFDFLLTPKFLYAPENKALKANSTEGQNQPETELSKEEINAIGDILKVVIHKIDYFALSFKQFDHEFVSKMFNSLSSGETFLKKESIVEAIAAHDAQIKMQDLCFLFEEFQSAAVGISWNCFSEYFDNKIWKV